MAGACRIDKPDYLYPEDTLTAWYLAFARRVQANTVSEGTQLEVLGQFSVGGLRSVHTLTRHVSWRSPLGAPSVGNATPTIRKPVTKFLR